MKIERVRTKRREHKVDVLSAWLKWANDQESTPIALNRQLQILVANATGAGAQTYIDPDGKQLGWLQREVLRAFTFHATAEKGADLELREAPGAAPRYTLSKGYGMRACYDGGAAQVGMVGLRAILAHPELGRITRCVVPGCPAPLVGRKGGRYCSEHGSTKARTRRHLEKFTAEERRARHRKLYLQWNRVNRPEHYRELLAIEAAKAHAQD
jgi:hypothetical protein